MIKIGKTNNLKVVKKVDFGLYLDGGESGEILLPAGVSMGEFPHEAAACEKLNVEVDGKKRTFPGIGTSETEDLGFRYVNLLEAP